MTQKQANAMVAVSEYQNALLPGTPEHQRAMIAGTMILTILPLTQSQLDAIDEVINL